MLPNHADPLTVMVESRMGCFHNLRTICGEEIWESVLIWAGRDSWEDFLGTFDNDGEYRFYSRPSLLHTAILTHLTLSLAGVP